MEIDCHGCAVRDLACGDCVVQALLGPEPRGARWDEPAAAVVPADPEERRALEVLAASGLVPRLRVAPARVVDLPLPAVAAGAARGWRRAG